MMISTRTSDERKVQIVAYTIILYISSLFMPFVMVASIHSMFYENHQKYWFFETPPSAYLAFMAGMVLAAVVITIYLLSAFKGADRKMRVSILSVLIFCVPIFICAVDNYYYATDSGIIYNKLVGIGESEYKWSEMKEVKLVYRHSNGSIKLDGYTFVTKTGEEIALSYSSKLAGIQWRINEKIEQYKLNVTDNYDDPIMN